MEYPPKDNDQFAPPPQPNTFYPPQQPWQQPQPGQYSQPYLPQQQGYGPPPMYQQPPPAPKKSRLWLWIVLGVLGVLLLSCIGVVALISSAARSSIGTISTTVASTATSVSSTTNQTANIGQTITVNGLGCTLTSVKIIAGDQFTQPKPGNEFIVVHVKLTNASSVEQDYNPFNFHVKSGKGNITTEEFAPPSTYTGNNELNSGKLAAGGTVEGDLIFQVPKGDHKAQLTWQPSYFGNAGDNAWNLGL